MRWLIAAILCLPALAANKYVRPGAGGTASGDDWTNAYASIPGTLNRGDTYYLADGTYGSYTFDDGPSSTTLITFKKATVADHGTATGWSDAYGDGVSTFTSWNFTTDYWLVDGQVGGGQFSKTGHGIEVTTSPPSSCGDNGNIVSLGNGVDHVTIRHAAIHAGSNNYPINGVKGVAGSNSDLTFQYVAVYNLFGPAFHMRAWSNILIEHSYMGQVRSTGAGDAFCSDWHAEGISSIDTNNAVVIRFTTWDQISGTAVWAGVNVGSSTNWEIYGNVIARSVTPIYYYFEGGSNQQTMTGLKFYNNTIVAGSGASQGGVVIQSGSGNSCLNNLFYSNDANAFYYSNCTHNYTYASSNIRTDGCTPACDMDDQLVDGEANGQNTNSNPFVSYNADPLVADYDLVGATNAGSSLLSPYNTDPDGITRGSDGTFDRGAFEFGGSGGGTAPTITTTTLPNGTVGSAYSQTISATGDATITCAVTLGSPPTGITVNSDCTVTGTPTLAESQTFTVTATNGVSPDDTQEFTLTITSPASRAVGGFHLAGGAILR